MWGPFAGILTGREGLRSYVVVQGQLSRSVDDLRDLLSPGACVALAWHLAAALAEIHDRGGAHGALHPGWTGVDAEGRLTIRPALTSAVRSDPDTEASAQSTDCIQLASILEALHLERLDEPGLGLLMRGISRERSRLRLQPGRAVRQALSYLLHRHPDWSAALVDTLGDDWQTERMPRAVALLPVEAPRPWADGGVYIPRVGGVGPGVSRAASVDLSASVGPGVAGRSPTVAAVSMPSEPVAAQPEPPAIAVVSSRGRSGGPEIALRSQVVERTRLEAAAVPPSVASAAPEVVLPPQVSAVVGVRVALPANVSAAQVPAAEATEAPLAMVAAQDESDLPSPVVAPPEPFVPTVEPTGLRVRVQQIEEPTAVPEPTVPPPPPAPPEAIEAASLSAEPPPELAAAIAEIDEGPTGLTQIPGEVIGLLPRGEPEGEPPSYDSASVERPGVPSSVAAPSESGELEPVEAAPPAAEPEPIAESDATAPSSEPDPEPDPVIETSRARGRVVVLSSAAPPFDVSSDEDYFEDDEQTAVTRVPEPVREALKRLEVGRNRNLADLVSAAPAPTDSAKLPEPDQPAPQPAAAPPSTSPPSDSDAPRWAGLRGVTGDASRDSELGSGKWEESARPLDELRKEMGATPVRPMEEIDPSRGNWPMLVVAIVAIVALIALWVYTQST